MWVVVTSPGARFGRVGRVRPEDWSNKYERKVLVQFGSSGPHASYVKSNLIAVAPLVRAIELMTGARYRPDSRENA